MTALSLSRQDVGQASACHARMHDRPQPVDEGFIWSSDWLKPVLREWILPQRLMYRAVIHPLTGVERDRSHGHGLR